MIQIKHFFKSTSLIAEDKKFRIQNNLFKNIFEERD